MTFFRTLFFFLVFWSHQLLILPLLLYFRGISKRKGPKEARIRSAYIGRRWGKMVAWLGGARMEITDNADLSEHEAVLIVSNHQGEFDIPILIGYAGCTPGFVAKKELEHIPLVSQWMRLLGCVFLDRGDRRRQIVQVREIIDLLKSGHSMVIFPEGTRSGSDELLPFAKGSLNIAAKAGVRIMPVTLSGSWKLKPKGKLRLPGGTVRLVRHPLLDPAALSPEDQGRLHEIVRDQIASSL
ncbi:MAG: 1-acyl-sn-glycerol-3-phosphate acyltransferase [Kiritimatiellae bacterium]|nr:1-acyl-sn-glycerol-3-phosphate acyltransferase [Kiritimatiellia bacterium]